MFFAEAQIRVHLYGQPTDMRKSYDGLQAVARHAMGGEPLDGALYIFINRADRRSNACNFYTYHEDQRG
jgi:transposase